MPAAHYTPAYEWHAPGETPFALEGCASRLTDLAGRVRLVAGVAPESMAAIAGASVAFAHVDVNYYLSTLGVLRFLLPRMSPGGVLVLDDFDWPRCPGVRRAADELGLKVGKTAAQFQGVLRF